MSTAISIEPVPVARTAPGRAPFVQVTALRKAFDGAVALRDVGFDVPLGSTVSLLGPSGCGKTTMLRSIAGLETPDAGRIRIGDLVVFDSARRLELAPEERQIGMVFQSYAVWPHMSVGENVGFPLKIRRTPAREIERRVRDVLALVGLDGLAGRPSTNLSGGQQQRVALARAIVHQPRLVLFDEPLSNLDAKLRHQMRTELKQLQNRLGFTAIYVTHDQHEALALADEVIVMNAGRVEAMGAPRELFAHPATPFVADFLGYDNMYDGRVASAGDGRLVDVDVGGMAIRCACPASAAPLRGTAVTVAFRSERVLLHEPGAAREPLANRYDGTVEASVYLGNGEQHLIRSGALLVRAVGAGDRVLAAGARVMFSIRPEDCIVFLGAK